MANKPGDFGGLPNTVFTSYLTFYRDTVNATLDSNGQRAKALAGLAAEEHAAAKSTGPVDVVSVVMKIIEIEAAHSSIVNGGLGAVGAGGGYAKVDTFITLLGDLEKLWATA